MLDRQELERLLCENIPDIADKQVWIWGAGNTAQLYQEGFKRLEDEDFVIKGYIDNDFSKVGKLFNGKMVIAPQELKASKDICVLICTIRSDVIAEVGEQLNWLGIDWYLVDEVILKTHRTEVLKCYDLMSDEQSKNIYANLIQWRIIGKETAVKIEQNAPYFCMNCFSTENPDEVFVDCGAYVGDTIEQYLKRKKGIFKKIISFEPDANNFEKLNSQIAKERKKWNLHADRIIAHPYGIAKNNRKGKLEHYDANDGLGSKITEISSEEEGDCNVVSLDKFLTGPYTFLKADIESYEYQMLQGAQRGIQKYKPLLAICIYHNAVDFYSIPLLVKKIVPEYKIAVRHHSGDLSETVLYAWT